jgi:hypothetical protein
MFPLFAETTVVNPGWFAGWGTLSLLNAGLAQAKNRSGLVWWLISLLLGPVATFLIVAFLDKDDVGGRSSTSA